MLKAAAILIGLALLAMGVAGFVPSLAPAGMLFNLFHINLLHNAIHLVSGILGVWTGCKSARAAKVYLICFGLVYVALGVTGFVYKEDPLFGFIANSISDTWLHTFLGILLIYIGVRKRPN